MAKKKRHTEHADERWLLTYADMITLLMALFMVLFSMSVVNEGKFEELSKSLKQSFSGPLSTGGKSVLDVGARNPIVATKQSESEREIAPAISGRPSPAVTKAVTAANARATQQDETLEAARREIEAKVRALGLQDKVQARIDARGLVIRLVTDEVLFAVGRAEIRADAIPLLATVAHAINGVDGNPIRVEGYTDALPFGDRFGNDELSAARAFSVWKALVTHGFDDARHPDSAHVGFGPRNPAFPNGADGAEPRNRRVEVVVLRVDHGRRAARLAQAGAPAHEALAPAAPPAVVEPVAAADPHVAPGH